MTPTPRALTAAEVRDIIRSNRELLLSAANPADDAWALSGRLANLVLDNRSLVDSITAAGLDISTDQAALLGIGAWAAAAMIIRRTHEAHGDQALMTMLYEEMAPLLINTGGIQ